MQTQKQREFLCQHLSSSSKVLGTHPLESKIGSAKLNSKRCQVCLNISKTDTFESFQNQT